MRRARAALQAEGYKFLTAGTYSSIFGGKSIHTAGILCNPAPESKIWVNIVVASVHNDQNQPGAERVKLQARMEQAGGTGISGKWRFTKVVPQGNPYPGTYAFDIELAETNGKLTGTGKWSNGMQSNFTGEIKNGEITLNRVDPNGFRGVFFGKVTANGQMEGTGQNDSSSPGGNSASYTWTAVRVP